MKDIYSEIVRLLSSGTPSALATIIQVMGSSPRGVGAKFLIPKDNPTIGSVGGGCLEAEVWQEAMDSINRETNSLMRFKLDDESMVDSGLICGGTVAILVEPLQGADGTHLNIYQKIKEMREQGEMGILATVVSRGGPAISPLDSKILLDMEGSKWGVLSEGELLEGQIKRWCAENSLKGLKLLSFKRKDGKSIEVLLEQIGPDPTLYIFGAGHISQALSPLGKMAGFKVVIIDDRPIFADPKRFPEADEVLVEPFEMVFHKLQINPQSYLVIVTRGHLYDGEVLEQAIRTSAGYIGMIGSKRKIAILYKGLIAQGIEKDILDRVYAPIGIDIHSDTPEEIAISIIAQMIKIKAENTNWSVSQAFPPKVELTR